jgi:hypothetical protein
MTKERLRCTNRHRKSRLLFDDCNNALAQKKVFGQFFREMYHMPCVLKLFFETLQSIFGPITATKIAKIIFSDCNNDQMIRA